MGSHNFEIHEKGASEHGADEMGHVTPFSVYVKVAGTLFALTFLTVAAHAIQEHLEPFAAVVAFGIASVKAYLVMAFFMHLKYETKMNRAIFISGFLFLILLFAICTLDIYTRIAQSSVL